MVLQRDRAVSVWGTAKAGEKIAVEIQRQKKETAADNNGKWSITLEPLKPGDPVVLKVMGDNEIVLKDILVGDVWICAGQSNMVMPVKMDQFHEDALKQANNNRIRLFDGEWRKCTPESVAAFSAVGFYYGLNIQKTQDVPIGLVQRAVGGSGIQQWIRRDVMESEPTLAELMEPWKGKDVRVEYERAQKTWREFKKKEREYITLIKQKKTPAFSKPVAPQEGFRMIPEVLYDSQIKPILPFAVKGALWYQGEANGVRDQGKEYRTLMQLLIKNWRNDFQNPDMTFLIVQLPGWTPSHRWAICDWPEVREAQFMAAQLPNTGMAVTIDLGHETKIHPFNKRDVGYRLSLIGRAIAYGEKIEYSGPVYKNLTSAEKGKMAVSFNHAEGLKAGLKGEETVGGFYIAGADKKFHPASASIEGNRVIVSSEKVPEPVAVRYAWANNPKCNLYNDTNLPAAPFRTDDWDEIKPLDHPVSKKGNQEEDSEI